MNYNDFLQFVQQNIVIVILLFIILSVITIWLLFKKKQWFYEHRHGLIQTGVSALFLCFTGILFYAVVKKYLYITDAILIGGIIFAVLIAVVCSHAYNYSSSVRDSDTLYKRSAKIKATWLHAYFCWETINVGMTVIPLYCTCSAIYISGSPLADGTWDHTKVLIYSILSLVISLSVYVIRPGNRASGFRHAYQIIDKALIEYEIEENRELLSKALVEGEHCVTAQDILNPQ